MHVRRTKIWSDRLCIGIGITPLAYAAYLATLQAAAQAATRNETENQARDAAGVTPRPDSLKMIERTSPSPSKQVPKRNREGRKRGSSLRASTGGSSRKWPEGCWRTFRT